MEKVKSSHESLESDSVQEERIKAPQLDDAELDAVSGGVPGYWDYDDYDSDTYPWSRE